MTAPASPTIYGRVDDGSVSVRWRAVADATDYKLYAGATTAPSGLEDDIADDDIGSDGWFNVQFEPDALPIFITVTALNVGAEESTASNELNVQSYGSGRSYPPEAPHAPHGPATLISPFG